MKKLILLYFTFLLVAQCSAQYLNSNKYAIQTFRLALINRLSLRVPQPDLEKADEATKLAHFREKYYQSSNFPADIVSVYPNTAPTSEA